MHDDQVVLVRERISRFATLGEGSGLEIGALDSPIAPRDACNVRYVDVTTTDRLRERFLDDPNVNVDHIVDVDFVLRGDDGDVRSLSQVAAPGGPYDWVIASHVIEHVPDLIGWLEDLGEVLADDGHLLLVVPDKRYTFDTQRPLTTVGQILEAHTLGFKTPSERAVFDHFRSIVSVSAAELWAGRPGSDYPKVCTLEEAAGQRRAALDETGRYIDVHVWLFTPEVLVEQITELGRLGMCDFVVEDIMVTAPNELEFYVALRRIPRDLDERQAQIVRARGLQAVPADREGASSVSSPGQSPVNSSVVGSDHTDLSEREVKVIHVKRRIMRGIHRVIAHGPSANG